MRGVRRAPFMPRFSRLVACPKKTLIRVQRPWRIRYTRYGLDMALRAEGSKGIADEYEDPPRDGPKEFC